MGIPMILPLTREGIIRYVSEQSDVISTMRSIVGYIKG